MRASFLKCICIILLVHIGVRIIAYHRSLHKESDGQLGLTTPFLSKWESSVNMHSVKMKQSHDVLQEGRRLFDDILEPLIGQFKAAMLFGLMDYDNKGDAAIQVGQFNILYRLNISVCFVCLVYPRTCCDSEYEQAKTIAKMYSPSELVMLFSGGGHFATYKNHDDQQFKIMDTFPNHKFVMLSASLEKIIDNYYDEVKVRYKKFNGTFLLRDIPSYNATRDDMQNKNLKAILTPDMAIGLAFMLGIRVAGPALVAIHPGQSHHESPRLQPDRHRDLHR